jgi:hypothetical protein
MNLPLLEPAACPVTPSHDSDPMSQPAPVRCGNWCQWRWRWRVHIGATRISTRSLTIVEPEAPLRSACA